MGSPLQNYQNILRGRVRKAKNESQRGCACGPCATVGELPSCACEEDLRHSKPTSEDLDCNSHKGISPSQHLTVTLSSRDSADVAVTAQARLWKLSQCHETFAKVPQHSVVGSHTLLNVKHRGHADCSPLLSHAIKFAVMMRIS